MNSLALLVQEAFKRDPHGGDLYVFRGKSGQYATFCIQSSKRDNCIIGSIPFLNERFKSHRSDAWLASADGARVRQAFAARLDELRRQKQSPSEQVARPTRQAEPSSQANDAVVLPVVTRQRDRQHLRFIIKQPCLVCGRQPCDPHHLRFAQPRGLGQKVSDEFTVPLCRAHHRELHRAGTEVEWWSGIEPLQSANVVASDPPR